MTQSTNRILDDLAKLMTDAAGAAQGAGREFETVMRAQAEKFLSGMDLVRRDEFEAIKAVASKAREDAERLEARIASLEQELASLKRQA